VFLDEGQDGGDLVDVDLGRSARRRGGESRITDPVEKGLDGGAQAGVREAQQRARKGVACCYWAETAQPV